ncbi:MAG: heavy metal translocating P-type ATPase [Nitrososphaera sp.]
MDRAKSNLKSYLNQTSEVEAPPAQASITKKVSAFVRRYPMPVFSFIGLVVGTVLQWGLGLSEQAQWIWLATLVIGGVPVVWETAKGIASKHFASDIVATLAIIAALLLNDGFPGVVIVLMQTGGKALEDYAFGRASSSLDVLLARSPRLAHRKGNGAIKDIAVEDVRIGDILLIRQGDLIPVDGRIISGATLIDESSLTGEPLPKAKTAGDGVFSGTVNTQSVIEIEAEKPSSESQYAKIVELVRKAQQDKAPLQRLASKYAVWFTPITVAVALVGYLVTGRVETILSVLVVATPCALIFATPVAIISGINRAAKHGIIIKHGAAIEQVGKAELVVFDKTGTITSGSLSVTAVLPLGKRTSDDLLFKASSVEQLSSHPAARVLAAKGFEKFRTLQIPSDFTEIPGAGVQGRVNGEFVKVGSRQLFEENFNAAEVNQQLRTIGRLESVPADGSMLAYVSINDNLEGAIVFGDTIRPGVRKMINDLHLMGVRETVLLTGDNERNAVTIARNAGIERAEWDLLPQDKVSSVKKLKEVYRDIVMVGDGINDAPALATATVGIAMGAKGTAISAESADIVLLVDDVTKVADVMRISQRTISIAKQSIFIGLGVSIFLMAVASTGAIPPALGAMLQEILDVAVILNAVRAR